MTKADLIQYLADNIDDMARNQAVIQVEACIKEIKTALKDGNDVMISGFGKFSIRDKKARRGRNPHTGDILPLKARRVVIFKPSMILRNAVNKTTAAKQDRF